MSIESPTFNFFFMNLSYFFLFFRENGSCFFPTSSAPVLMPAHVSCVLSTTMSMGLYRIDNRPKISSTLFTATSEGFMNLF